MTADLEVTARTGMESDLDVLAEIRGGQLAEIADARGGALLTETDVNRNGTNHLEHFRGVLGDDERDLIVGTLDGLPFGYGLLSFETLLPGRILGTIDELLVAPDAREVGLGEAIMNDMVVRARSRGCFGVDSRALPGDRETKNFFESFGLKARMLVVHRALEPDS